MSTVYVMKCMKTGHAIRISIPRDVQRHLSIRVGDILGMALTQNGEVRLWKISTEELLRARARDHPAGPD